MRISIRVKFSDGDAQQPHVHALQGVRMFYTMEYTKKPRLRIRYSAISVYILFACSALSRLSCLRLSACGNLLPSSLQCLAGMKHAIGQSVMICFLFPDRTLDFGVRDVSACVDRDVTRMFLHIIQAHIVSIVIFCTVLSFILQLYRACTAWMSARSLTCRTTLQPPFSLVRSCVICSSHSEVLHSST